MKIVILSTQRSGSTLVCKDLAGTSVLGNPDEHFLDLVYTSSSTRKSSKELDKLIEQRGRSPNGVVSIKVMANYLNLVNKLYYPHASPPQNDNKYLYFYKSVRGAYFIRVIRNDLVAQSVSRIMAQKTGIYHKTSKSKIELKPGYTDSNSRNESFPYDRLEITKEINNIKSENRILDYFVKSNKIETKCLQYEIFAKSNSYLYEISADLNLGEISPKQRQLKKIAGDTSELWIRRYKKEQSQAFAIRLIRDSLLKLKKKINWQTLTKQ